MTENLILEEPDCECVPSGDLEIVTIVFSSKYNEISSLYF